MSSATQEINLAGSILDQIKSRLTEGERQRFSLQLLDATRQGTADGYGRVLAPWAITVAMREHPDYQPQLESFRAMEESGALYEGTTLTANHISRALAP